MFLLFSSQLSSGDASDSICPKGWGIAEWSEDRSYQKVFASVYRTNKIAGIRQRHKEYDNNIIVRPDILGIQLQLEFAFSGMYNSLQGKLDYRASDSGYFWENRPTSSGTQSNIFILIQDGIYPQSARQKNDGFSVRCVAKNFIF